MYRATRDFLRDWWALTLPYWKSEERWRSGALLAIILAMTLGLVGINVWFNEWRNLFYNSLQDKDYGAFIHQIVRFTWMALIYIAIAVYYTYFQQMLQIRWRRWLTAFYVERWMRHQAYYRLQLGQIQGTDNPDQRISDDVNRYVDSTLNLVLGFINSLVTLVSFAGILWGLSGSLMLWGMDIPGYMLWVAVVYAGLGTFLIFRIGRPLVNLNFLQQRFEANFRFALVRLRENAEGVALYGGEAQESRNLTARFADLVTNWWGIMRRMRTINMFSAFYGQLAVPFPYLVAAPRFFSGAIQLGGLMQTASAFDQVQSSLSWFIGVFGGAYGSGSLAEWRAVVDRLTSFEHALIEMGAIEASAGARRVEAAPGSEIATSDLDIRLPDGRPLLEHLSLHLKPGSRTLLIGPSGSGKSTLFRVISGLWPYCSGALTFPKGERLLFLPQKPYLPIATLRVAVCYPDAPESHDDASVRDALTVCGLAHLIPQLDDERHWGQTLSGGEQQRVAIARALLLAPRWLFLDEATSNLDDMAEAELYRQLVERLPHTAIVSIAHRATLDPFHQQRLELTRAAGDPAAHLVAVPLAG